MNKALPVLAVWGALYSTQAFANETLFQAVRSGNLAHVQDITSQSTVLNSQDKRGYTPLMVAIEKQKTSISQYLLKKGCNPNIQSHSGKTALMLAAQNADSPMVKLLLKYKANPYLKDHLTQDALSWASVTLDLDSVQLLETAQKTHPLEQAWALDLQTRVQFKNSAVSDSEIYAYTLFKERLKQFGTQKAPSSTQSFCTGLYQAKALSTALAACERQAKQGQVKAMNYMGELYALGWSPQGVNLKQAKYWYQQAASAGSQSAKEALQKLHRDNP